MLAVSADTSRAENPPESSTHNSPTVMPKPTNGRTLLGITSYCVVLENGIPKTISLRVII